jgi:hypothetical protein
MPSAAISGERLLTSVNTDRTAYPPRIHDHAENSARPAVDHSTAVGHPPQTHPLAGIEISRSSAGRQLATSGGASVRTLAKPTTQPGEAILPTAL